MPACTTHARTRTHAQVLYKLDRAGVGEEICYADLPRNTGLSFLGFSPNMFLEVRARVRALARVHEVHDCVPPMTEPS